MKWIALFPFLISYGQSGKVLFLVTEGLTEELLNNVPTPALDALIATGTATSLKPEFPAEMLPTLEAMMTGQHVDMTGVIDREVSDGQGGVLHSDNDPEFWSYNPNISSILKLSHSVEGVTTGCIQWPGSQFGGCDNVWKYGDYDIVTDVQKINNETLRVRRSDDDGDVEEMFLVGDQIDPEEIDEDEKPSASDDFFFDKSKDQEWLLWDEQINKTVNWFSQEDKPVNFVLFNVYQPGNCIRTYGPNSIEANQALQKVDQMIALLVEKLKKNNLFDDVNIVITGLHGFVEISADKVFDISQFIGSDQENLVVGHSPVLNIQHTKKNDITIYNNLQKGPVDKYDIYPSNIPDRFHYRDNERVGVITLVAKEGFAFSDVWTDFKQLNFEHNRPETLTNKYGMAGYDNSLDSMQSLVILHGPGIERDRLKGPQNGRPMLDAVDMFPLLSHLLDLPTIKTNGSINAVRGLLKYPPSQSIEAIKQVIEHYISGKDKLPNTVLILSISTALVMLLICCGACAIRRQRRKALGKNHNYKYSSVKHNRRDEGREDGSESNDDKVGLLTSAIMEEELEDNLPV